MGKQKREVEWSFDFDDIGSRFSEFFDGVMGKDIEVETAELEAPLDGATSATVNVDFSVGRANVVALQSKSDNIFEAKITYVGEYEFEVTGTTERQITLRQKSKFPRGFGKLFGNHSELIWNVALSQQVPYDLHLKGGVGEADIDLTNLTVEKLNLDTGVGKVSLTLPIQKQAISASLNGGVGKTEVIIPASVSGHLDINGGVGEVVVVVAPNTAIRVEADSGIGGIHLPKAFNRVSGQNHFMGMRGVWETPNFDEADQKVVIDYDGGVGSFNLKYFEVV